MLVLKITVFCHTCQAITDGNEEVQRASQSVAGDIMVLTSIAPLCGLKLAWCSYSSMAYFKDAQGARQHL